MLKRQLAVVCSLIIAAGIVGHCFSATVYAQSQEATRAREVARATPAEVTVTLNEQFFNSLLDAVFTSLKAPTFPLSLAGVNQKSVPPAVAGGSGTHHPPATAGGTNMNALARGDTQLPTAIKFPAFNLSHPSLKPDTCESVVTLERETSGVKTAVRFENGRVVAPLAFKGAYSVALIGCVYFRGWADTVINLNFDRQRQVLSARVTIVDIHLNNIPSLASGMVIRLVQNSLDSRINPIEILQAVQLSTRIPIAGSGGALRMRATEIRPEVVAGALSLHIFYEFAPAE